MCVCVGGVSVLGEARVSGAASGGGGMWLASAGVDMGVCRDTALLPALGTVWPCPAVMRA